jgi:hypothetical protein
MSKDTGGALKGYRKLRVGEVIRNKDVFMLGDVVEPAVMIGCKIDDDFKPHYRPIPAKKVERWYIHKPYPVDGNGNIYYSIMTDSKGVMARVWSLKDARLITAAVNKHLEA